jgi:NTE family protein
MRRVVNLRRRRGNPAAAWVLGGGGARGAAQVGAIRALVEHGVQRPAAVYGASVGALDGAVMASRPDLRGTELLRELWLSDAARDVFRFHTVGAVLSRLSGQLGILSPAPVRRLIEQFQSITECQNFDDLEVQLKVVATDVIAGRRIVFRSGGLAPALLASAAIPGVFPPVIVDGQFCSDGGIVDNLPIGLAVEEGYARVLAIGLMGASQLAVRPSSWTNLVARTLQLSLHHRLLSDFERYRRQARITVICPVTRPEAAWDMDRAHVESLIERSRAATAELLDELGDSLFDRSAIYYLDLTETPKKGTTFTLAEAG